MNASIAHKVDSRLGAFVSYLPQIAIFFVIFSIPWVKFALFSSITITDFFAGLFIFFLYIQLAMGQRRFIRHSIPSPIFWVFTILWICAILNSGFGAQHTGQYLFESIGLIYVMILGITVALVASQDEELLDKVIRWTRWTVISVLIVCAVGVILAVLVKHFDPFFFSRAKKLIGPFRFPNQLGGFLVLFLPFLWERVMQKGHALRRILYGVSIIALFGCVVATGSRTAVGAAVMGVGLYLFSNIARANIKMILVGTLLVALFIPALQVLDRYLWVVGRSLSIFDFKTILGNLVDPFRLENWQLAVDQFLAHPLTGYGLGNIEVDFGHEVHNTYLAVLAETGLFGFLAFSLLFGYFAYLALKNVTISAFLESPKWSSISRALLFGALIMAVYANYHMMLRSRYIWLFLGLIAAVNGLLKLKAMKKRELLSRPTILSEVDL
jgi:O-antigen ligase